MENKNTVERASELSSAEQILVLPGCLFFIETIEVPVELEASEVPDFAELSLESIAPFPIDQLNWGYLYREGVSTMLLYATQRDRLKNAGYGDLEDCAWVLPDFATLSGARFTEDTIVTIEGKGSFSLLYFERSVDIPKSVWVDVLTEPMTDEVVQRLKSTVQGLSKTAPTLKLRPAITSLDENNLPTFEHAPSDQNEDSYYDGFWQKLKPTETQLWQTDVRSTDFKTAERSKRRTSALIARIIGWAAVIMLLLIGMEGTFFIGQEWLNSLHSQINDQSAEVGRIENKQDLTNKLDQVAQNKLRPITILEAANDIRLKLDLGIEYDSAVIEGENYVTIEGKASSVNAINRYADSLKNSGLFELLTAPEYLTKSGKTTFKVSLAYRHVKSSEENTPEPVEEAKI